MDKNRSSPRRSWSLSTLLALGVGGFVVCGSGVLVMYFQYRTSSEEESQFASLARNNALFLDQARLPPSDLMAERLGRVMGARVVFRDAAGGGTGGEVWRDGAGLHVAFPLRNGREVCFTKGLSEAGLRHFWDRWDFWLLMAGFWGLSVWLSWWLARQVTRPLARVAAVLPAVGKEPVLPDLPEGGPAEIRALAETLRRSHGEILGERGRRRRAERLAMLGKMATSLAHEVKNPVAAIRLHGQLLSREVTGGVKESIDLMVDEADRIELLLARWMSYARPEPGKLSDCRVLELVEQVVLGLAPQARHADVEVMVNPDPGAADFVVRADRARLIQVFQNLLLNSIQAIPCGGRVEARVRDGGVEIVDDGSGFSALALQKAGEAFFSEREGGMGLGLAVSKEILGSQGATLTWDNRKPKGAIVRIEWCDREGRNR